MIGVTSFIVSILLLFIPHWASNAAPFAGPTSESSLYISILSKQLAIIDIALANKERETPEYIQMDEKNKKVKFVRTPKFEEVPYPIVMEPNLVIEYYSR